VRCCSCCWVSNEDVDGEKQIMGLKHGKEMRFAWRLSPFWSLHMYETLSTCRHSCPVRLSTRIKGHMTVWEWAKYGEDPELKLKRGKLSRLLVLSRYLARAQTRAQTFLPTVWHHQSFPFPVPFSSLVSRFLHLSYDLRPSFALAPDLVLVVSRTWIYRILLHRCQSGVAVAVTLGPEWIQRSNKTSSGVGGFQTGNWLSRASSAL